MKKQPSLLRVLLLGVTTTIVLAPLARAQVIITPDNPTAPAVHNSITIGTAVTGGSVDGYDFFSAGGSNGVDLEVNSPFATITRNGSRQFTDPSYSSITIGGTTTHSGVTYEYGGANDTLATINLTSNVPSTFTLGFLDGSTNDSGNDADYELQLFSGSTNMQIGSTVSVTSDFGSSKISETNDFFYATISGFTPADDGDYIKVLSQGPENSTLAGITFSVPEPSTYALMLTGAGVLAFVVLRRRQAGS